MHTLSLGTLEHMGIGTTLIGYAILICFIYQFFRQLKKNPVTSWFMAYVFLTLFPVLNFIPLPSLIVAPYRAGITGLGAAALLGALFAGGARNLFARRRTVVADIQSGVDKAPVTVSSSLRKYDFLRKKKRRWGAARLAVGMAFVLWCGNLTVWGISIWKDEKSVFGTIARYDPYSIVARYNLATALVQQKKSAIATERRSGDARGEDVGGCVLHP